MNSNNPVINLVRQLKKGESIEFDRDFINIHVQGFHYNEAYFTAADRVLENIIGSAYEYTYSENPINGNIAFHRLGREVECGKVSYTSPDRR